MIPNQIPTNQAQLKEAIEAAAIVQGRTEIEVITDMQAAAATLKHEAVLEVLCDLKWIYIDAEMDTQGIVDKVFEKDIAAAREAKNYKDRS